jgi:hypothetical protein
MFEIKSWTPDMDLTEFYEEASRRGFENNANQKMLVDSLAKEQKWCVLILYYNKKAVGSAGAHSLPEFGPDAYRICARTCIFTDMLPGAYGAALRTKNVITHHQNPTSQFFIPALIEWAGIGKDLYISTNASKMGSQQRVNNIFAPLLEKTGILKLANTIEYRGHLQHFWQLNVEQFYNELDYYGTWL